MKLSDRTVLSFVFRLFCLMVWISIGIMSKTKNGFKPMRGRNLPLHVDPQWSSEQFLPAAVKKQKDFNQDMEDGEYVLLYPDGSLIKKYYLLPLDNTKRPLERHIKGLLCTSVPLRICCQRDSIKVVCLIYILCAFKLKTK